MKTIRYDVFDPLQSARLGLNYLTTMVDERRDSLPYWLVAPHETPAWAEHCRVDDAELVASWYEAIVSVRQMLRTREGAEVQEGFRRHLMKSWGAHGLRFHEKYPWTHTMHSSFHEMAYVLSALNRILENNPRDREAERRAKNLVRGMRALVIQRKVCTFWSGDFPIPEPVYEFPNDVYLQGKGFDLTRHTGRGEQAIRNGMMLHPLVVRYDLTGDKVALDLACGIANHLLGTSRYFNWKMEFFGHVHSAVWVAAGLVRLGRLLKKDGYIRKGRGIYDYVRSLSSSFGWVPEYAQWHPDDQKFCETCCIKDMLACACELIDCGYAEYWNDLNLFFRNQLIENQVKSGSFVTCDNAMRDTTKRTYRDIDKRIVGGWSGGTLPNSMSLLRFRSIAGCCAGTAPQALQIGWDRVAEFRRGRLTVNLPVNKVVAQGAIETGYPNEGRIAVTVTRRCDVAIRLHPWMPRRLACYKGGVRVKAVLREGCLVFRGVRAGQRVEVRHDLRTRRVEECIAGRKYVGLWRGPDLVDLLPHGEPLRLYQRVAGRRKVYPKPKPGAVAGGIIAKPTQQTN